MGGDVEGNKRRGREREGKGEETEKEGKKGKRK
jgi:hypothetical protein